MLSDGLLLILSSGGPGARPDLRMAEGDHETCLSGDTEHPAISGEVADLKHEARDLSEVIAGLALENCILKKRAQTEGDQNSVNEFAGRVISINYLIP